MRLLLCLAASLVLGQAARIPRGIVQSEVSNFHAVHHGHGATSYQNVQLENYGSVPIPTEHHHELEEHQPVIHVQEEPHYVHHEDHLEVPLINLIPIDRKHHLHDYILVEAVPYVENEVQHVELHDPSQLQYYSENYDQGIEYEYH